MARMKIHMVDQKEILRLKGLGHSKNEVSKLLRIDRGTVLFVNTGTLRFSN